MNLDVDLDVDGIRGAPLSLSNSITCTATTSTSTANSRSRSKSRSQNRDSHAKMEFLKNYAALGCQPALCIHPPHHPKPRPAAGAYLVSHVCFSQMMVSSIGKASANLTMYGIFLISSRGMVTPAGNTGARRW
jgi:hypothetical protein